MFYAEIVDRILTFFTYLITLGKDVTLLLIAKFKTNIKNTGQNVQLTAHSATRINLLKNKWYLARIM